MAIFKTEQQKLNKRLYIAIKKQDLAKVTDAINAGAQVNEPYDHYMPLSYAINNASWHSDEIIMHLIDVGADVNPTYEHHKPIFRAINQGLTNVVKALVEKGAQTKVEGDSETALHRAAERGMLDLVRFLVERGCDPEEKNGAYETPSILALKRGHHGVISYLSDVIAERNAAKNQAPEAGWTMTAADEIAHITENDIIGYRLTRLFNFTSRTCTQLACNLKSGSESQAVASFDNYDEAYLEKARRELQNRNGTPPVDSLRKMTFINKPTVSN